MAFEMTDEPMTPKMILINERNKFVESLGEASCASKTNERSGAVDGTRRHRCPDNIREGPTRPER